MGKVFLFLFAVLYCLPVLLQAQLRVETGRTPESLVREVLLGNVSQVEGIRYQGSPAAIGWFSCTHPDFPVQEGIILSTGEVAGVAEPSGQHGSTQLFIAGDSYLSLLSEGKTYDAAVLEFTFVPEEDHISFEYIFASEEYPEYVDRGFNDVFAFVLTDLTTGHQANLAFLPSGEQIHVDNINHLRNREYYIDNASGVFADILQFDGFTTLLRAETQVVPHRPYHIRMAIADVHDRILDSGVMLKGSSFNSFSGSMAKEAAAVHKAVVQEETLLFDFDSSALDIHMRHQLDSFFRQLSGTIVQVEVTGHTDSIGPDDYNDRLSAQRVISVADYLLRLGVPKSRIRLDRYGEARPLADNSKAAGRQQNRRVKVRITCR